MKHVLSFLLFSLVFLGCKKGDQVVDFTSGGEKKLPTYKAQFDERKLIQDGQVKFQTDDVVKTDQTIRKVVKSYHAWISDDHSFRSDSKTEYNLTIRVPSQQYDSLTNAILEQSDVRKLDSKSSSLCDVTEDFIDVEARLKIKRKGEQQLATMLTKAKTLAETLEIQKQLTDIRAEIESTEGRMKYLSDQVKYSLLHVQFYVKKPYSERFIGSFWNALKDGWEVFLYVLTGLAYLWVILLVVVLGRWGYKRYQWYVAHKNR